jgi:hypothetical protein
VEELAVDVLIVDGDRYRVHATRSRAAVATV